MQKKCTHSHIHTSHTHMHTLSQKSDAPLISREKDDAYTYSEDYNVSFRAASSHL